MAIVPTLDEALTEWADHNHAARYELLHGTDERAAIRATLATAAAQAAQALAHQEG